ncbi:putative calsyntenin-1-like [Brachionus plicatilis]|uniref:Putative calsyntenin-1-like n=1 Tax=Brachionus plicatilis TaxID=10195 RepID=A0A3M7T1N2_BRAPC|nr:putative calsyntenin-1-like [Brachionus plicatilis]
MLRINLSYLAYAFAALGFIVSINEGQYFFSKGASSSEAPVLDVENESTGYIGTIGERNVLVDLKPHLQIKNIESINGICSYHVFKPTSEDFPFTIDIKDKLTGEAVIEVVRKETIDEKKTIFLDCHKRKEYDFLIQAHDCSTPSVPSKNHVIRHFNKNKLRKYI